MMDLAMNFDADECLVTAMFDKGNRNDTMEAIDHIIPFLKGDADMIGLVCNTIRKLFCMSDEGYEVFLMDLEEYKMELEEEYKSVCSISGKRYPRVPGCAFPFLRETEKRRKNSPDRKLSAGVHWKNPAGGNSG